MSWILGSGYHRNAREQSERGVPPNVIVSLRGRPASERAAFGDIVKKLDFWRRAQFWGPFGKQTPQVRQRPFFKLGNGPPRSGPASAMALSGDCVAPRNYRSAGIKCVEMIRVILTDEACDAIASTLSKGAARWPTQRDRGQCFSQVEAAVVDRMRVTRVRGESYSEVILRLVELKQAI